MDFDLKDIQISAGGGDFYSTSLFKFVYENNLRFSLVKQYFSKAKFQEKADKPPKGWELHFLRGDASISLVKIGKPPAYIWFSNSGMGSMFVTAYGTSLAEAKKALGVAEKFIPAIIREKAKDDGIMVTFWSLTRNGPDTYIRNIVAPAWNDIGLN